MLPTAITGGSTVLDIFGSTFTTLANIQYRAATGHDITTSVRGEINFYVASGDALGTLVAALNVAYTGFLTAAYGLSTATLRVTAPTVPASATAAGVKGDIAYDANFAYICTATNT